jgi:hypothetical protein
VETDADLREINIRWSNRSFADNTHVNRLVGTRRLAAVVRWAACSIKTFAVKTVAIRYRSRVTFTRATARYGSLALPFGLNV